MSDNIKPSTPEDGAELEYVWGYDDETYLAINICSSVDEALAAARDGRADAGDLDYCTIGRVQRYDPADFFPTATDVISHMLDEAAGSDAGEYAASSDWLQDVDPRHIDQLDAELKAVLRGFFDSHPEYGIGDRFFLVEETQDYYLVPEDEEDLDQ